MNLIDLAQEEGGRIIVLTGALIGLDATTEAAEGKIESVRITPPASFTMPIANVLSENPITGRIRALCVLAASEN